jgi:hypothetical protein
MVHERQSFDLDTRLRNCQRGRSSTNTCEVGNRSAAGRANYYIGSMQVTGTYSSQDIEEIVRFIRGITSDEVIWVDVPLAEQTAYTNGDLTRLPTDVAEVSTSDGRFTVTGSRYKLKRTAGGWHLVETLRWIR